MGGFPHVVGLPEILSEFGRMMPHIVCMTSQLSRAANSLLFWSVDDFLDKFSCIMTGVAFESLWKPGHHMESTGISNDRYQQSGELHHVLFSVMHRFLTCKPNALVVQRKIAG
jgi:hypothetical protein